MSDGVPLPNTTLVAASDEVAGQQYQRVKLTLGADGVNDGDVSSANPIPIAGSVTITNPTAQGLTDTQLRATPVPVSTGLSQAITDAQMRATPIPVSGTFWQATQPVSGTFWQAIQPVSGTVTVSNMVAQGLTDTQLRASAVTVSGTVTVANPTAQGLTDTQLRATEVPVSLASAPVTPVTGTFWQATQSVSAVALPLPTGAATETTLAAMNIKLPALSGGRIPVELPAGGSGLTDTELRAIPVKVEDIGVSLLRRIFQLLKPLSIITGGGSNRLSMDVNNIVGGTVTTVSTVSSSTTTNQVNNGGVNAFDMMKAISRTAYNQGIRSRL